MKAGRCLILIIFSVLVGLIFGLPHILIPKYLGEKPYSPLVIGNDVPPYTIDETFAYATRTQEALKNPFFISDPAIIEYKELPSLYISESIPAKTMALLSRISGSVPNAYIVSDFIFPLLSFLLILFLVFLLTNNFNISLVSGFSLILGSHLLKYIQFPYSFLLKTIDESKAGILIQFTRSFHPQVSFIFFITAVLFLYLNLVRKERVYILLSGLSFGLLFYAYIYYISFFTFSFVVLFFLLLIFKYYSLTKRMLVAGVMALIISIPLVYTFVNFVNSNLFGNMQINQVTPLEDTFWLSVKIIFTILLAFVFLRPKRLIFYFIEAFLISGLFLSNLPHLLNKNVQLTGHLSIRAIYPWIIISIFTIVGNLNIKRVHLRCLLNGFLVAIFAFLFIYGVSTHANYSKNNFMAYTIDKSESDLYSWLNLHTDKDSVVMTASLRMNLMLLALTHNRVFIPHSFLTFAPSLEILERIYIVNKLIGATPDVINGLFERTSDKEKSNEEKRWDYDKCGNLFVFLFRYSEGNAYQCFTPDDVTKKIVSEYQNYLFEPSKLKKYKADYLLIGPYERSVGNLSLIDTKNLEKVYKNASFTLYRLSK